VIGFDSKREALKNIDKVKGEAARPKQAR